MQFILSLSCFMLTPSNHDTTTHRHCPWAILLLAQCPRGIEEETAHFGRQHVPRMGPVHTAHTIHIHALWKVPVPVSTLEDDCHCLLVKLWVALERENTTRFIHAVHTTGYWAADTVDAGWQCHDGVAVCLVHALFHAVRQKHTLIKSVAIKDEVI